MRGSEARSPTIQFVPLHAVSQQIAAKVTAAKARRQGCALVNEATIRHVSTGEVGGRHVIEVAESIRVVQRPVFAEALPIIRALHSVKIAIRPYVGAVDQFTVLREVQAPGVAASFAE